MKTIDSLVKEIITSLGLLADQKRKELATGYYPTSMEVIGVIVPDIRNLIKSLLPELKVFSRDQKVELAIALVDTAIFECQQIAYEIIGRDKKVLTSLTRFEINKLDQNQDNWVSVDTFSGLILGVCWRLGTIRDRDIIDRIEATDFWIRRQALVATLGWNQKARGGTGNSDKTLMVCTRFIDDHHDMINKALSWALRELSKIDKDAVQDFLDTHESRLHGRVKREVQNKLTTGRKNPA